MNPYKLRQVKACAALRERGFHKAIVGDPMSILYLTGIHITPYERFYGLVLDTVNGTAKMVNPSVDTQCMKGTVPEITHTDEEGPLESLKTLIAPGEKLAVETKYYSMDRGYMLAKIGAELCPIGDCLDQLRMCKDDAELETMRFACKIVHEALEELAPQVKPGMTEKDLYEILLKKMKTYPGFSTDEVIILALAGPNSANCHGVSGDYVIKEGDVLLFDFCAYYNHYWSDITRCFFLGTPSDPRIPEIYEIVRKANEAAIAKVRPGIPAKEIDKAARDYITAAGYGEYFLHRTGHGLGLSVHEEPNMNGVNELILREGMTFTIEPGIYLEGVGGIRIEDNILVTKDGCEVLTRNTPKDLAQAYWNV